MTREQTPMIWKDRGEVSQVELDRYGIERVPTVVFLWGGYHYADAQDALAAAKRNFR